MPHVKNAGLALAATLICFSSTTAYADALVHIDPDAYAQRWRVDGSSFLTGAKDVSLTTGFHTVSVGAVGAFQIQVASDGTVTSLDSDAATASGSNLTFRNATIIVDPGAYSEFWSLQYVTNLHRSVQPVVVVPGLDYNVLIGLPDGIQIHVAGDGTVTSYQPLSATGAGNTLTFRNTTVAVDPGAYGEYWRFNRATALTRGGASVVLVPNLSYYLQVGVAGSFTVFVAADGTVTSHDLDAATTSGNMITFNTTTIEVDPGLYAGLWKLEWSTGLLSGTQTVTIVPSIRYRARVGLIGVIEIDVAADGSITSHNIDAAAASGNRLLFENTTIDVDPGAYLGHWRIFYGSDLVAGPSSLVVVPNVDYRMLIGVTGTFDFAVDAVGQITSRDPAAAVATGAALEFQTTTIQVAPNPSTAVWQLQYATGNIVGGASLALVPNVIYRMLVSGTVRNFSVAAPCAINPPAFALAGVDFALTCGAADSDGDGVPDDTDNCLSVPNPDQVDQDLDGFGNLCDPDLDGDGFANASDNCPEIANDQVDLDGDGLGDACDADIDDDSVPDTDDNCVDTPNIDQADSDGDLVGDACDLDDDDDGIPDDADNCPFMYNTDQADTDDDGDGDACDGDRDGDGTANEEDLCADTPADLPVNVQGCSGGQHIASSCDPESFVQHGQYVSCVAHAANDAVSQGLLTPREKSRFVRDAARSR